VLTALRDLALGIVVLGGVALGVYHGVVSVIDSGALPLWPLLALLVFPLLRMGPAARSAAGHSHGDDLATVRRHEAGHVVAGRAVGGRIRSARVSRWSGSGWVDWDPPQWPIRDAAGAQAQLTFLMAGELAAGNSEGCGYDRASVEHFLRAVPAGQRGRVRSAASSHARRIVSSRRAEIDRVARRL
jgi:hypothetical protein